MLPANAPYNAYFKLFPMQHPQNPPLFLFRFCISNSQIEYLLLSCSHFVSKIRLDAPEGWRQPGLRSFLDGNFVLFTFSSVSRSSWPSWNVLRKAWIFSCSDKCCISMGMKGSLGTGNVLSFPSLTSISISLCHSQQFSINVGWRRKANVLISLLWSEYHYAKYTLQNILSPKCEFILGVLVQNWTCWPTSKSISQSRVL